VEPEIQEIEVLVVDDERDIRDGCERILVRKGCRVAKATNGAEALDLIEKAPYAIVLLDLKMPGMDGMEVLLRIHEVRPETLVIVITGYATIETAIEAMKRGAYDFIPKPFKPDQLRIVVDRAMEKKRLTDEAGRLDRERRRTLKDLDMEKSRTRTIIQALPDGVMVSTPDAHVALMNPAFIRMLRLKQEEIRPGERVDHYILDESFCRLVIDTSLGKAPAGGSGTCDLEREGGTFLRAQSTPVLSETGECLGAVTVLVDITELKMLDRLKSEFVTQVSHELRSPLSTIQQQLAMVLSDFVGDGEDEQRHILSRAKEKTQGLITLIGDILDLSRMEAGLVLRGSQSLDVRELLKAVVDFLAAKARGKKQTLTLTAPETGLPAIVADPQALEIVFSNLITNAIHYTGEGGAVEVDVSPAPGFLCVAVRDNGFGIEERHQERIFEKFYRIKNDKTRYITGTGLGLPIVKGIVDALGGRIELESQPGKGSTFRVFLPVPASSAGS
jgi:two-component system, OmpR family, phosphate regulon sensor histidine kinase PhoR